MKRKKKFLALVLAAVMLLSSITIALAVTTAEGTKPEASTRQHLWSRFLTIFRN